jgi:succinate dehydrogenase / fumarate reductase flavoprotein subunit
LLVFGKRAGEHAAAFARSHSTGKVDAGQVEEAARRAVAPFERDGAAHEGGYQVQHELQDMMQDLVGIVRNEKDMLRAQEGLERLKARAAQVGVGGNREYNPGWHTALDLENLLTVSEAITRSALTRKESRGGHFREDFPEKDPESAKFNIVVRKGRGGEMQVVREGLRDMPDELKAVIKEMG